MRVAVISPEQMCGKSSLMAVLGAVYSRTQGKDVAIISTGEGIDNLNIIDTEGFNKDISNAHIFKATLEASDGKDKTLLYYGAQAGDEHVHVFDLMGNTMGEEEKAELIVEAVRKLPADLTMVEICGDVSSPLNQEVLKECHVALCCIDVSKKHFRLLPTFISKLPDVLQRNVGYVLTRYNPEIISDKAIKTTTGISVGDILRFPYNTVIGKLAMQGNLDKIAYQIVAGDYTCQNLRMPMLECMQYLFDTDKRKIIRGMDKWSK